MRQRDGIESELVEHLPRLETNLQNILSNRDALEPEVQDIVAERNELYTQFDAWSL